MDSINGKLNEILTNSVVNKELIDYDINANNVIKIGIPINMLYNTNFKHINKIDEFIKIIKNKVIEYALNNIQIKKEQLIIQGNSFKVIEELLYKARFNNRKFLYYGYKHNIIIEYMDKMRYNNYNINMTETTNIYNGVEFILKPNVENIVLTNKKIIDYITNINKINYPTNEKTQDEMILFKLDSIDADVFEIIHNNVLVRRLIKFRKLKNKN